MVDYSDELALRHRQRLHTRARKTHEDPHTRVVYYAIDGPGRVTVNQLLNFLNERLPANVGFDDVHIHYPTIKWEEPATEEEMALDLKNERDRAERTAKWEKDYLRRLLDIHGLPEGWEKPSGE